MSKIKITCLDCKKDRLVETNGMKKLSYELLYLRCHKCAFVKIRNKCAVGWFKKGQVSWNKDKRTEFIGKTKDGLHAWVERNLGKPKKCTRCGDKESELYQWSNISGQYKAKISDWQRLCVKCHCRYDYENFGARKVFFKGGNPIYV